MALGGSRIAFVGAGNIAEALVRGLLHAKALPPGAIVATGRRPERLRQLADAYAIRTSTDNAAAVADADIIVLSVKPQIIERALDEIAAAVPAQALVLSVAAGVPMRVIERRLDQELAPKKANARVCRAMPNTPVVVGQGATAFAVGSHVTDAQVQQVQAIFSAVGIVTQVEESLLDAVTGLSGSGPAYVMLIIEALSDAGVKVGLPRYQAQLLAAQTVLGSARLLIDTGDHPGVLKDKVTSPGGTAIVGLHTLEEGGLRTTLINAVVAATARAKELGDEHG